jgi:acyl-CoA reductase-like NAD-dependent aldehyde dehydrogenase
MESLKTISPVDGSVYVERPFADADEIALVLSKAERVSMDWKATPLATRQEILGRAVTALESRRDQLATEITWQMGRPIVQSPGEIGGLAERARHMIEIAPKALARVDVADKPGFTRFISREALGVVFVVAPWNYPYLTSVNAIVPALLAGNSVVLKHSAQTPLCAERYAEAFAEAGLPEGVFQYLHLTHEDTTQAIQSPEIAFVAFTGSVAGGASVERAAAGRFIGVGLELGGKDPAYVRLDADLDHAVSTIVDGAFFNSGQSCCGIERVYVQQDCFDEFVSQSVDLVRRYRLGRPDDESTTLGPVVRASAADAVRGQIRDALAAGAKAHINPVEFQIDAGPQYCAPQVLTDVNHSMSIMREETFGPTVGIMSVENDAEAIALMNDSSYGLTASVFTRDEDTAIALGEQVETGTWFMNRCDYLDPALAWTGVKQSGRGCTLSSLGFEQLTRPKSFHLKTK